MLQRGFTIDSSLIFKNYGFLESLVNMLALLIS